MFEEVHLTLEEVHLKEVYLKSAASVHTKEHSEQSSPGGEGEEANMRKARARVSARKARTRVYIEPF